ncbi:MAG: hypothetical protein E7559_02485 [Ruminococcaceae bacterium]|nr:hypothetical protein [Oscillospiraceae bacterium]
MQDLQTILIDLLCIVLIAAAAYFADKLRERINSHRLRQFVEDAVEAAEGMLHDSDPDGKQRLGFVIALVKRAGYIINDEVRTIIEAAVYRLNQAHRRP